MPDEDEGSAYIGLEEAAMEFERLTRIKMMDDATLFIITAPSATPAS